MQENQPKVSVITVCLNAATNVETTINSVLNQSYPNTEYLVVDGGSSDGTISILENHSRKASLLYISEPDNGIYDAMNKAIKMANGDLIIFLNAGDYFITPDVLEFSISKMKLQSAELFFGRIVWVDPQKKDIVLSDHVNTKSEWDLWQTNFPHPATFYKKLLFSRIGFFSTDFKILGDYEWNAKALIRFRIPFQYLNIAVTLFRADGISNNPEYAKILKLEKARIVRGYSRPLWLFSKFENIVGNSSDRTIIHRVLKKIYNKRLNRIN